MYVQYQCTVTQFKGKYVVFIDQPKLKNVRKIQKLNRINFKFFSYVFELKCFFQF